MTRLFLEITAAAIIIAGIGYVSYSGLLAAATAMPETEAPAPCPEPDREQTPFQWYGVQP